MGRIPAKISGTPRNGEWAGKTWTNTEKQAGTGARLLKHEDPPPQSVYYNPDVKKDDPPFLNINLRYQTNNH